MTRHLTAVPSTTPTITVGTRVRMFPNIPGTVVGTDPATGKYRVQDDTGTVHTLGARALQIR